MEKILQHAIGRRKTGADSGIGEQSGIEPAIIGGAGKFDEGLHVRKIAPDDAIGVRGAVETDIAVGGEPGIGILQQTAGERGNLMDGVRERRSQIEV